MSTPPDIIYIGRLTFRNSGTAFGILAPDRRYHLYCIGKTGAGKSTLFSVMAAQDAVNRRGFALFDPHGSLIDSIRPLIPTSRRNTTICLDAGDPASPWRFNPFAGIPPDGRALATAGMIEVFKKLWPDEWGPRLEHLFRHVVLTILALPAGGFADIPRLLTDKDYRKECCDYLHDDVVREFWETEFARYSPAFRAVVVAPLQNKVGAILADPVLNRILTTEGDQLDLRRIMDSGQILLVSLDKGRIGEGPASLLGSLLVSHIALAGISRSDQPEEDRRDFTVYLDEFHTFTTLSLATMLSELRKYRVSMCLAHQYIGQLDPDIRDAVFGNVGTLASFRVGGADAGYLAREFAPTFSATDLTSLQKYNMYLRLCINGEMSAPFSAMTFASAEDIPNWMRSQTNR